jgi:hypothetical protein
MLHRKLLRRSQRVPVPVGGIAVAGLLPLALLKGRSLRLSVSQTFDLWVCVSQ